MKIYPAIFTEDERGGYYIQFPDVEGNGTQGITIEEGLSNASDYLGIMLSDYIEQGEELPEPSKINSIKVDNTTVGFVTLVDVDIADYIQDNKLDRTNTSIPHWLKVRAEKQGINFSKLLTEALMERLGV